MHEGRVRGAATPDTCVAARSCWRSTCWYPATRPASAALRPSSGQARYSVHTRLPIENGLQVCSLGGIPNCTRTGVHSARSALRDDAPIWQRCGGCPCRVRWHVRCVSLPCTYIDDGHRYLGDSFDPPPVSTRLAPCVVELPLCACVAPTLNAAVVPGCIPKGMNTRGADSSRK